MGLFLYQKYRLDVLVTMYMCKGDMTMQIVDNDGNDLYGDKWFRICEKCGDYIEYTNKRSWYNAKARNSQCKSCQSKQASENTKGVLKPNYPKNRRCRTEPTEWKRDCPDCGKPIYYGAPGSMNEAIAKETLCGSCTTYKSGRNFSN